MPGVNELVGNLKTQSDLTSEQVKIRYNESVSVSGGGTKIQLKFPKIPGKMLNMNSIFLHFTTTMTGADVCLDTYSFNSFFNRVRLLSSSNVLLDIYDYGSLATTLAQAETSVYSANPQSRKNQGLFVSSTESKASSSKRCAIQFPKGSLLNCSSLIPLDKISGHLTLELYLADPKKILFSTTNDVTANFTLSDIQILCDYIQSPSLSSYYDSNGLNFHVNNWSHRFQPVPESKTVLRIPSAYTSLSKLLILIRDQSKVDATNILSTADRQQSMIVYNDIQDVQLYSNNSPLWSESIVNANVQTELWNETLKCFPQIEKSSYFTDVTVSKQVGGSGPIGINLQSAPKAFHDSLISGLKSKSHVSDLYSLISWKTGITTTNYCATVFLANDSRVFVDSSNALQIEF